MFGSISRFYDLVLRDAHAEPEEIVDVTRRALQERITAAVQEVDTRAAGKVSTHTRSVSVATMNAGC